MDREQLFDAVKRYGMMALSIDSDDDIREALAGAAQFDAKVRQAILA